MIYLKTDATWAWLVWALLMVGTRGRTSAIGATAMRPLAAGVLLMLATPTAASSSSLHAVGGNCSSDKAQQGWTFDSADDTIKFGSAGCLSEPPN